MSNNDYYVIVSKILVYLYKKYLGKDIPDDYICERTTDFPISDEQLRKTIEMMADQGFIKGKLIKAWGGDIVCVDYNSLEITPKGIDYMIENTTIRKICNTLKEAKSIFSLFQ